MAVVVAYKPGPSGRSALALASQMARSAQRRLVAVSVVPAPWPVPGLGRVDAEFREWAAERGEEAVRVARDDLEAVGPDVDADCVWRHGQSVPSTVLAASRELDGEIVVVGSAAHGGHGQVVLGSTSDHLLHASAVPVAVATRGYRTNAGERLSRVTCCFSGDSVSTDALGRAAAVAAETGTPLRIVTLALTGRQMYPPEVGFDVEKTILDDWLASVEQAQENALRGVDLPDEVSTEVGHGHDWEQALDSVEWSACEVLVLGSSHSVVRKVFLGSHATKIVRHAPVPVVAVPAGRMPRGTRKSRI